MIKFNWVYEFILSLCIAKLKKIIVVKISSETALICISYVIDALIIIVK